MSHRYHGHTNGDISGARAVCDRCNFVWMRSALQWQYEFRGATLKNIRLLVCPICIDTPNYANYPIRLTQDPVPVKDPRIEQLAAEEAGLTSGIPIV